VIYSDAATTPETGARHNAHVLATAQTWLQQSMPDSVLRVLWVGTYSVILLFFAMLRWLEGISTRFNGGRRENSVKRGEAK
jgi:hypothetical protein